MKKILIVDDNIDVLQVMQLLLTTHGYAVEGTTNGEETIQLADTFRPNLIFLDIHLSGVDGRDISRKIKTGGGTKNIPVILFSANFINDQMLADSKADEFVAKPFDIHNLLAKVEKHIGVNQT